MAVVPSSTALKAFQTGSLQLLLPKRVFFTTV